MSLEHIREHYRVPAEVGAQISFDYQDYGRGTIVGAEGSYLLVEFDKPHAGEPQLLHPTWNVTYLERPA